MADLYTSLCRAKQILMATRDWRGEDAPPPPVAMTPVPERLHHIIRPEYTIGMGALRECGTIEEDGQTFPCPECRSVEGCQQRGLQCPVCGEWCNQLARHLNLHHEDVGGAAGVKRALSIPAGATLLPMRTIREHRVRTTKLRAEGRIPTISREHRGWTKAAEAARRKVNESMRSVGVQNLRNSCYEQTRRRIAALRSQIGRSPSVREAEILDPGLVHAAKGHFGTWNNALTQCGVAVRGRKGTTRDQVLEALAAWYEVHGELPSRREAAKPTRAPVLPNYTTIRRIFDGRPWEEIMRIAASELGIRGGRYGLPEKERKIA